MTIDRDESIKFHEQGTLDAVTRWVSRHDEGIAEWLKNVRSAYRPDRANVEEKHRAAVLLLKDLDYGGPARIGLLDVGGATLEDVSLWSTWQDPDASTRSAGSEDEGNQGNGGKAYMYRLFAGDARVIGVRDGRLNCKGFVGTTGSVERGTPGFIPDAANGRELEISSWEAEVDRILEPYAMKFAKLPVEVQTAIRERRTFTLVEGIDPVNLYKGRILADALVRDVLRHEQSTLAIQQLRLYVAHQGRLLNAGKACALEPILPYPGFEIPHAAEIPEELRLPGGELVSTTDQGARPRGRLTLHTSRENMLQAYKSLKPRWKVTYRTQNQMVGSKPVSELAPATPGSYFVYGTVELPALEPGYVDLGRRRPKDGPLIEAVDAFVAEKIRDLAKEITARRRQELDDRALDEVHKENKKLDQFKNKFLPSHGDSGSGGSGTDGKGPGGKQPPPRDEPGTVPDSIELAFVDSELRIGRGVSLNVRDALGLQVKDAAGRTVPRVVLEWHTSAPDVLDIVGPDTVLATQKGRTEVWATVKGKPIESQRVTVAVWVVDHVLLAPRTLELPLGQRKQIVAEVTDDDGYRATNVYLDWRHDADDQLIVRIRPTGWVSANRIGKTTVSAGAGDPSKGGVWSRIHVEVSVVPNAEEPKTGGGFPQLLLTGRDIDPETGQRREGDPDSPALWQEITDFYNNVWWINLASPEAAFAFNQRAETSRLWRVFHVQKVIEMVVQVHMQEEFTRKGEGEQKEHWGIHRDALWRYQAIITMQMWDQLQEYVAGGGELE